MHIRTLTLGAVVAALAVAPPAVTLANTGGQPHSTNPCPTHSHTGKHKGSGKGHKKGSGKGKKCGGGTGPTGSTGSTGSTRAAGSNS